MNLIETREIKIRVWQPSEKKMSEGMTIPMLAGYITGIYPNLKGDEVYMELAMHDKDGKEVYEGDIIRQKLPDGEYIGVMGFNKGLKQFGAAIVVNELSKKDTVIAAYEPPEVIGNVYQNPGMLAVAGTEQDNLHTA